MSALAVTRHHIKQFQRQPRSLLICVCAVLAANAWTAPIDQSSPLEIKVQAELRSVERDGKIISYRYTPARHFAQGQELYYTVRIRNAGSLAMRDAIVIQPIPANTHYLAHSATGGGAQITFSVDGGKTFAATNELKLPTAVFAATDDSARSISRRAQPADYTHILWQLRHSLEPGAVVLARFRVVFN